MLKIIKVLQVCILFFIIGRIINSNEGSVSKKKTSNTTTNTDPTTNSTGRTTTTDTNQNPVDPGANIDHIVTQTLDQNWLIQFGSSIRSKIDSSFFYNSDDEYFQGLGFDSYNNFFISGNTNASPIELNE